MKFFHISDLHIGKQLNGYNLRESQEMALSQIAFYAGRERPDAILICGDIYDKSIPSGEAHTVFDGFLNELAAITPSIPIMIIAGNHDSPERLRYAASLLEREKIYISVLPPQSEGEYLKRVTLSDSWGDVNFYLFPFMKPGYVRNLLPEAAEGYDSAFSGVIKRERLDESQRNVILAHQFFIRGSQKPETCESEQISISVGGIDQVDTKALDGFDYAALGHLHGAQSVGMPRIRYSGSPLKYSVSEEKHEKSVTMVILEEKGRPVQLETLPLSASADVRKVRGGLLEVLESATEENRHDFVSITLTDEEERTDFRERLDERYDHILEIRIHNERTRKRLEEEYGRTEPLNPLEAFGLFFEAVRHMPMTQEQESFMKHILEEAKEGTDETA